LKNIFGIIIAIVLITSSINAEDSEAKKLCNAEIKKEQPSRSVFEKQCSITAKEYEGKEEFGTASWYYLLANKQKYNTEHIEYKIPEEGNFGKIAHSYILQNNLEKAKENYIKCLKSNEVPLANSTIQDDYTLLNKLYPNKNQELKAGLKLWNSIYKPLKEIDLFYSLYEKEKKNKELNLPKFFISLGFILGQKISLVMKDKTIPVPLDMGSLYQTKGNYKKALEFFDRSYNIYKKEFKNETHPYIIAINISKANIYKSLGFYKKSLQMLLENLEYAKKIYGTKSLIIAKIKNLIGLNYLNLNEKDEAIGMYYIKWALSIKEEILGINHPSVLISYNSMGLLYQKYKYYDEAFYYFDKALNILEQNYNKNLDLISGLYNNLGFLYNNIESVYSEHTKIKKNNHKALQYYKKSLSITEKILGTKHPSTAIIYNNIGLLYDEMGDYKKAYKYLKKSYNIFIINRDKVFNLLNSSQKKLFLTSNSKKIPFLFESGYSYANKKLVYNNTNEIPEWLRASLNEKVDKKAEAKKKAELLQKRTLLYQDLFNAWLNYKGSIFDSENAIATLYANTTDKGLIKKIERLIEAKRNLAKLYQTLPKPKERKTWQSNIKLTEEKIASLTKEIASKAQSFKEQQGLKDISYTCIAKNLKEDELYIDYAKAGEYYYIFTLDNKDNITFNQIDKKDTKAKKDNKYHDIALFYHTRSST